MATGMVGGLVLDSLGTDRRRAKPAQCAAGPMADFHCTSDREDHQWYWCFDLSEPGMHKQQFWPIAFFAHLVERFVHGLRPGNGVQHNQGLRPENVLVENRIRQVFRVI